MGEYETDILQWAEHQATLLRRRATGELVNDAEFDWPNIAEEIEAVGRSERIALASHVRRVIEHLAKLETSPAMDPRRGWIESVLQARAEIEALLEASPSLARDLPEIVQKERPRALRLAAAALERYAETPAVPVNNLGYTLDQIVGPWLPGSS